MTKLKRLIIKLWDTCQFSCPHCANSDGPLSKKKMSPRKLRDIFRVLHPAEVEFTGGEPAFYPDRLLQAVRFAKSKPYVKMIMVNSNLELMTNDFLSKLEAAGLTHLHFALYTLDAKAHKKLRGNQKADIGKVLRLFNYMLEHTSLKIIVEYVPMAPYLKELKKVYAYLSQKSACHPGRIVSFEVSRLIPTGRALKNYSHLKLELQQEVKALLAISHLFPRKSGGMPAQLMCYPGPARTKLAQAGYRIYPCALGSSKFYISPDGRVSTDNFSCHAITASYLTLPSIIRTLPKYHCPYLSDHPPF
jgi:MoaA/NifB/PqqE/SkfB family radical SAM enzyme